MEFNRQLAQLAAMTPVGRRYLHIVGASAAGIAVWIGGSTWVPLLTSPGAV
jgi:hypothetical protein